MAWRAPLLYPLVYHSRKLEQLTDNTNRGLEKITSHKLRASIRWIFAQTEMRVVNFKTLNQNVRLTPKKLKLDWNDRFRSVYCWIGFSLYTFKFAILIRYQIIHSSHTWFVEWNRDQISIPEYRLPIRVDGGYLLPCAEMISLIVFVSDGFYPHIY